MSVELIMGDWQNSAEVMPVMESAFDPVYGEAWSQSQLSSLLITPGNWLIILRVDGKIAGFALARSLFDEAELMLLGVDPVYRNRGLGRQLLGRVITESKTRDASRLFLEVRADNENALILYERAGFVPVGRRPRYYRGADGALRDAITMSLTLN